MLDFKAVFEDITKGNQSALHFCQTFLHFVHMVDDLVDRDIQVPADAVSGICFNLMSMLATNEFFQEYKSVLLPTIMVSSQAWACSERFKKRDNLLDKVAAQVLKSEYQNVFLQVAYICGGQAHFIEMAQKYREFNYDKE